MVLPIVYCALPFLPPSPPSQSVFPKVISLALFFFSGWGEEKCVSACVYESGRAGAAKFVMADVTDAVKRRKCFAFSVFLFS